MIKRFLPNAGKLINNKTQFLTNSVQFIPLVKLKIRDDTYGEALGEVGGSDDNITVNKRRKIRERLSVY